MGMSRKQTDQSHAHERIRPPCDTGEGILGHRSSFVCPGLLPRDWLPASELAECSEVRMWESSGFKESASDTVLVASDGSGGSRETRKSVRQVACGVATFSLQPLSDTSFKLLRTGFLGGLRYQADRWFQEPSCGELSRISAESTRSRMSKFRLMRNIMHRVTWNKDQMGTCGQPCSI